MPRGRRAGRVALLYTTLLLAGVTGLTVVALWLSSDEPVSLHGRTAWNSGQDTAPASQPHRVDVPRERLAAQNTGLSSISTSSHRQISATNSGRGIYGRLFDFLCTHTGVGDGCCRTSPDAVIQQVNKLLGEAILREAKLQEGDRTNAVGASGRMDAKTIELVSKRPQPLSLDCSDGFYSQVLTGKPYHSAGINEQRARFVIDAFIFSQEVDVLEGRLYELNDTVDLFVIGESRHTHRGSTKPMFLRELLDTHTRFGRFKHKILHVDVDQCDSYMEKVALFRDKNQDRARIIWPIQMQMRACVWKLAKSRLDHVPDDAIVMFGDADELAPGRIVNHLKHCELSPDAFPMSISMSHVMSRTLRLQGCHPVTGVTIQVTPMSVVREDDKIPFRSPAQRYKGVATRVLRGGLHFTSAGSMAALDFKSVNYPEGGMLAPLDFQKGQGRGYCRATLEELRRRHETVRLKPFWSNMWWKGTQEPSDPQVTRERPTKAMLYGCDVPWVLIENPDRYPALYAEMKFDDIPA